MSGFNPMMHARATSNSFGNIQKLLKSFHELIYNNFL